MTGRYARERKSLLKSFADHCHDKGLEALTPERAAQWIALAETLLWCAYGNGDSGSLLIHAKPIEDQS